ncbi:MAG: hypothetical protein OEL76_12260 [Siculibacillus sp.]|nr:hypothetical protein [Siculibacillus sp.]
MGDLLRFPVGSGANVIRAECFRTKSGDPVEILSLVHRGGEAVAWQTGDQGTIGDAIAAWRACGVRLDGSGTGGRV